MVDINDIKKLPLASHQEHLKSEALIHPLNKLEHEKVSFGHKLAESTVKAVGSWKFIFIQTILIVVWSCINIIAWAEHWDPYPFILLNLFLTIQAAYTAPIIMMGQNRQAARDRLEAHNDFLLNIKAEKEIQMLSAEVQKQQQLLEEILKKVSITQDTSGT